jgi:hypothetical protein
MEKTYFLSAVYHHEGEAAERIGRDADKERSSDDMIKSLTNKHCTLPDSILSYASVTDRKV